jgi:two-component system phosphate regulon response regulator PhoB
MRARGEPLAGARESPLVLVVEDDPETRHFYALTLDRNGFTTEEAHNGFQALDKAIAVIPDLILSDIAVPGIDGIELCRRLRADPRTAPIPILAVTGYDDRRYPDRILAAGANRVLIKPFAAETLLAEARALLRAPGELPDRSIA